jgi:hypothetical protein
MPSWCKWCQAVWGAHGTKISGFAMAAVGTLTLLDHETIDLIGETLGPAWGPRVKHGILIVGGLVVARRGFSNSQPK